MPLRPKDVAAQLGVSTATLRLWSTQFAQSLSPSAQSSLNENGAYNQRRYDDADVAIFQRAKTLLARGLTYEQVAQSLLDDPTGEIYHDDPRGLAIRTANAGLSPDLRDAIMRYAEAVDQQSALLEQLHQHAFGQQAELVERLNVQAQATQTTLRDLADTQHAILAELRHLNEPPAPEPKRGIDVKAWWATIRGT